MFFKFTASIRKVRRFCAAGCDATKCWHSKAVGDHRRRKGCGRRWKRIERKEGPAKIRDPSGETWAGRGANPRWLVAAIKGGKKLDKPETGHHPVKAEAILPQTNAPAERGQGEEEQGDA